MKIIPLMAACAALMPVPAQAQATPSAGLAGGIDPARLDMARKVIDLMIPPAKRDKMIEDLVRPMIANMQASLEQSPPFKKSFADDPKARETMLAFMRKETDNAIRVARETMPQTYDAMAIAYARQFSVSELADLQRFYSSPTGQAYIDRLPAIMADPAVQAAQRAQMQKSFEGLDGRIRDMARKLEADAAKPSSS